MTESATNPAPLVTGAPPAAGNSGPYGPSELQSAYGLGGGSGPSSTGGSGRTIAIVDAYNDPNAESDLAAYRSQFGLPACTTATGCFRKVNQAGGTNYPTSDVGWAQEISLDLDMASAVCPNCHILLVEASSNSFSDLATAVDKAAAMGATQISNSYGGSEYASEVFDQSHYNHPGVDITVSSGDSGYGVQFPAASQYVTAVGGTSLTRAETPRGWWESAWSGAGSGCSAYVPKPSWQQDPDCPGNRTVADVSAVADPNTGVDVYDTYGSGGWLVFGGTSVAAPLTAGIDALRGASASGPAYAYGNPGAFNDVTSGSNGSCGGSYLCTSKAGYDGPTGIGTPIGAGASTPPASDFSLSASPSSVSVTQGQSATSTISTAVTSGAAQPVTLSASGLPSGVNATFNPSPVTAGSSSTVTFAAPANAATGTSTVTITGTGNGTTTHTTTITLTVNGSGSGSVVTNGGFETGTFSGWSTSGASQALVTPGHTSSFAAMLGGNSPTNGNSTMQQTVRVPAAAGTLSFWYQPHCPDKLTYDQEQVRIRNTSGKTLATVLNVCSNSGAWTQVRYNLSAYANQTIVLWFNSHDDNYAGDPTYTLFDDVSIG